MFSVVILFHHWFPLLEKIEIWAFILPRNFPAVFIIFTGRGGAGNPPLPTARDGAGSPPFPAGRGGHPWLSPSWLAPYGLSPLRLYPTAQPLIDPSISRAPHACLSPLQPQTRQYTTILINKVSFDNINMVVMQSKAKVMLKSHHR